MLDSHSRNSGDNDFSFSRGDIITADAHNWNSVCSGDTSYEADLTKLSFIDEYPSDPPPTIGVSKVTTTAGHGMLTDYEYSVH